MKIQKIQTLSNKQNTKINFTSRQNPIKPFEIETKRGKLRISEIDYDKDVTPKFIDKITKFFCDNFSQYTKDNFWLRYRYGTPEEKEQHTKLLKDYYTDIFTSKDNEQNVTLLVATDENNEMQAACLSYGCHEIPNCLDTALYIDSVAVNDEYKKYGVAKEMMKRTLDANKNTFTDSYLTSTTMANEFYEKLGYKKLDPEDEAQKAVLEYVSNHRYGYPEHIMPYTMALQEDKPRWFEKSAEAIEKNAE